LLSSPWLRSRSGGRFARRRKPIKGTAGRVYPYLLDTLNFLVSTSLVLFVMFRLLRFRTTLISLLTAVATTVFSYFIFAGLLGVVLPAGAMEEFILKMTGFE